jgi:hypothetical protein
MIKTSFICVAAVALLFGCTNPAENTESSSAVEDRDTTATTATEDEKEIVEKRNAMQFRSEIEAYREKVENSLESLEKKTIDLSAARAEISERWEKLDYYLSDDQVVRIKTYPHRDQRDRTEEFYFMEGELVFALMEKEGADKKGRSDETAGSAFYYDNWELILSMNIPEEDEEVSTDEEDVELAMRLREEAKEYLEMVKEDRK